MDRSQTENISDSIQWAHQKRLEARGETAPQDIPKEIYDKKLPKPALTENPIQNMSMPGEVINDKVLKARQGLLLLKSKMNRQETFSHKVTKPLGMNQPSGVKFNKGILKPNLKAKSYRKTFKPNFDNPMTQSTAFRPAERMSATQPMMHKTQSSDFSPKTPGLKPVLSMKNSNGFAQENFSNPPNVVNPAPVKIQTQENKAAFGQPNPSNEKPKFNNIKPNNARNAGKTIELPVGPMTSDVGGKIPQKFVPPQKFAPPTLNPQPAQITPSQVPKPQNPPPQRAQIQSPSSSDNYSGGSPKEFEDAKEELFPCDLCGRTFKEKALKIHTKSCRGKTVVKKTKPKKNPPKAKNNKWKSQSENFRAAMKAARTGKPMEAPMVEDGLVPCPHCKRSFNDNAAKRHIPDCEKRAKFMANRRKRRG